MDLNDISLSLMSQSQSILTDINDQNQQSLLSLLLALQEFGSIDSVDNLLDTIVPLTRNLFSRSKNEYTRGKYFDLMVNLYDRFAKFSEDETVRAALISGLSDE